MGMSIQQLGLYLRFHYVQYPTPGKTSPRFSAESPEKWTIPIHDGSFIPREVLMGSTHQISRFSLSKGTTCFYNNYAYETSALTVPKLFPHCGSNRFTARPVDEVTIESMDWHRLPRTTFSRWERFSSSVHWGSPFLKKVSLGSRYVP